MVNKGIDVSEFQNIYNFEEVKENGIEFAIIRAGFGFCTIDQEFFKHIEGFERVGIPYGAYWFSYALSPEDAAKEASFFCELLIKYCKGLKLPVFFDFEYESLDYAKRHGVTITPNLLRAIAEQFIRTCGEYGYRAGVYCNPDFIYSYYGLHFFDEINCYLWLADWSPSEPTYKCDIWQYSETGSVSGISGNVDLDECYIDFEKPEPKPGKTIEECIEEIIDEYDDICFGIMQGEYGSGLERKNKLGKYYDVAQEIINEAYLRKEGKF